MSKNIFFGFSKWCRMNDVNICKFTDEEMEAIEWVYLCQLKHKNLLNIKNWEDYYNRDNSIL